tara:strand:- start:477 stop:1388 length:912 start_codon:yes stop_codon:yes gene_type:complete
MELKPNKTSFGRNETFNLRYSWLNKGLKEFKENKNIFSSESAPMVLGVGKNMVNSIKYWLNAYQVVDFSLDSPAQTEFGKMMEEYDPYLENPSSLWLLHWKLCTNPDSATFYYWFFNHFKKNKFTKIELVNDVSEWLDDKGCKKVSPSTLERDALLLLKTFSTSSEQVKNFEESLENPFYSLNLLTKNTDGSFATTFEPRESLDCCVLGYCLIEIFNSTEDSDLLAKSGKRTQMPVSEFLNESPSISKIFRVNETFFYQLLEELESKFPSIFKFIDTAGQKTIELKDPKIMPSFFIKELYKQS